MAKLILIPGWHEAAEKLRVLADGRHGRPGLEQAGFACELFKEGRGSLRERIDQFAQFLTELKAREPDAFPVVTFGYSAGGLINRGFLRAYPNRTSEVAATVQLGTPNWGLITDNIALLLNGLRISQSVIADLDIESDFMTWLNETTGHWEPISGSKHKRWKLDDDPWVAPEGSPILNILGRIPSYVPEGDGLVDAWSGTLDGAIPHVFVSHAHANHLNLSGMWNIVTFLLRRWPCDDELWPQIVAHTATFSREATRMPA